MEIKNNDLISIVLTLYNKAPYIEETIFSIYKQTYTNRELIIVDDCSNDWSFEIAKSFCEKLWITNKCIFIQNEKNLWVAKTFERWLKEAKWDWISMCDWDDILMKNKLEENLSYCKKNKIDFFYSDLSTIDSNNNILHSSYFESKHVNLKYNSYKDYVLRWRANAIWSSIFFSNHIWNELKKIWFPNDIYQDRRTLLYVSIKGYNIWYTTQSLVYYRRYEWSISRELQDKIIDQKNNIILKCWYETINWENTRYKWILEKNICIDDKDKNRCQKHLQINSLLLDFINNKMLFMKYEVFKLLFKLWDPKYYYRIFIIQIRKILTYFVK